MIKCDHPTSHLTANMSRGKIRVECDPPHDHDGYSHAARLYIRHEGTCNSLTIWITPEQADEIAATIERMLSRQNPPRNEEESLVADIACNPMPADLDDSDTIQVSE